MSFTKNWNKLKTNRSYYRDLRDIRVNLNNTTAPSFKIVKGIVKRELIVKSSTFPVNKVNVDGDTSTAGAIDIEAGAIDSEETIKEPPTQNMCQEEEDGAIEGIIDDDNVYNLFDCDDEDLDDPTVGEDVIDRNDGALQEKLRVWGVEYGVPHIAINRLLRILSEHLNEKIPKLPLDTRTLLQTPKVIKIQHFSYGDYWHQGVIVCLQKYFQNLEQSMDISLNINIDGLPIHNGSSNFKIILFLYKLY